MDEEEWDIYNRNLIAARASRAQYTVLGRRVKTYCCGFHGIVVHFDLTNFKNLDSLWEEASSLHAVDAQ